MKKILISIVLLFIAGSMFSQTVLLEENVAKDSIRPTFGPNLTNFSHFYIRYGFVLGPNSKGGVIEPGLSNAFEFGYRYKLKLCNFYALGLDVRYESIDFVLHQNSQKLFPNTILHDKEKLVTNNFSIDIYNRINIGRRGNSVGKFLDFGVYSSQIISSRHYTKDKLSVVNANNAKMVEVNNKKLVYINKTNYGFIARLGINRYVIFGSYRISDLFTKSYQSTVLNYPEMPRFIAGLEIGLF